MTILLSIIASICPSIQPSIHLSTVHPTVHPLFFQIRVAGLNNSIPAFTRRELRPQLHCTLAPPWNKIGTEKIEQLSFLDRLLFSSWPLPHSMQPLRNLVPNRCTPHSQGCFKHDYLAQRQQRPLCIHVTPGIKSMAVIISLPSEGKSAAYLIFNVELRGMTSGLKSKYTHG